MSPARWPDETRAEYVAVMGGELAAHQLELEGAVVELHRHWALLLELFGTSPERVAMLNQASPGAARMLSALMVDDIILRVSRLTDPPKPGTKFANLSLRSLPALVEEPLRVPLEMRLEALDREVAAARTHRDKSIAHADLQHALAPNGEELPTITRDHLARSIAGIDGILQAVHAHYRTSALAFWTGDVEAAAYDLLDVVRLGVRARAAREARLRRGEDLPEDSEAPL